MNPLVDASLVKVNLAAKLAERMQVVVKLFSRDTHVTVQAPNFQELLDRAQLAELKALPSPDAPTESAGSAPAEPPELALVMSERIGIVKAWDFNGTRAHVEFVLLNNTDQLVAIRNVVLLIGPGPVPDSAQFKQFVEVTPDARVPSERYRLPVVVAAGSGLWLCAELEGPIDVNFGAVDLECTLLASLNTGNVSYHFTAQGNPIFGAILDQIQKAATEQKGAAAFELPISSSIPPMRAPAK